MIHLTHVSKKIHHAFINLHQSITQVCFTYKFHLDFFYLAFSKAFGHCKHQKNFLLLFASTLYYKNNQLEHEPAIQLLSNTLMFLSLYLNTSSMNFLFLKKYHAFHNLCQSIYYKKSHIKTWSFLSCIF